MALKKFYIKDKIEVGCDEAGRGCLAGPVVAAAVILQAEKSNTLLNDSKQVSKKNREELRTWIEENAIAWAIGIVSHKEIDQINILNASFLAMHRAIDQIKVKFDHLLIDGNRFNPYKEVRHHCVIKGDSKYTSIAAASILAKTHRDEIMLQLDREYPEYQWKKNQGYPTKHHRDTIINLGISPYHRMSFRLINS
ncbi:MAG: ribonuclease HII [Flavobacteriales bacterium]|nr:ribonuclease HII [Flavobacteriales bacterium]